MQKPVFNEQTKTAADYINHLALVKHPEGGYYKETYRSQDQIKAECLKGNFDGDRHFCTAIYYLLEQNDFSAFHRIKSDECWHFYEGQALLIHMIEPNGAYSCIRLGREFAKQEHFQFVVPAGFWFASEPAPETSFALVGCTVAPGFDFKDFEMADKNQLLKLFPQHASVIKRLCR